MTVPESPTSQERVSQTGNSADDALSKLHHMSTTAGVASQRYVAFNTVSIIGALLGLASGLMFLSPLLVVIPILGLIVSIVGWRQINDSGGTETGKLLAVLGVLLSVGIGGVNVGQLVHQYRSVHRDVDQMTAILDQLAEDVRATNYNQAYQLFGEKFKSQLSRETLESRWSAYQNPKVGYGTLESLKWNGVDPYYESIHGGDERLGFISALAKFEKSELRLTFEFRSNGDRWQLENIQEMFSLK
jgi:hypothetical protein